MTLQIRPCKLDDFTSIFDLFKQLWPSLELDYAALYAVYENALSSETQHLIVGTGGSYCRILFPLSEK